MLKVCLLISVTLLTFGLGSALLEAGSYKDNPGLRARLLRFDGVEADFEITITNGLDSNVFLCTNPKQVNGEVGPYLILDNSRLEASYRVYKPPIADNYTNQQSVELIKLAPGETYKQSVTLYFPLDATSPPHEFLEGKPRPYRVVDVKTVVFIFGYFLEVDAIEVILRKKQYGSRVKGNETILRRNGEELRLLQDQELLFSNEISLQDRE